MVFNENLYMIGSTLLVLGYICATVRGSSSFTYANNKTSEPACYGSTYTSFVSLRCPLSEVLYPFEVNVGAKPNSTGCPDFENDHEYQGNNVLHKQCCRNINETVDCINEYNGPNRTQIIERCLGLSLCENKTHVVWESTYDMTCPELYHYKSTTNYAFLDYYCIQKSTIGTPARNHRYQSRSSDIFYLTANDINSYKNGILDRNVTCSVTASSNRSTIEVWIMDLRFRTDSLQRVIIFDQSPVQLFRGSNHTRPSLQLTSSFSSINVTFETVRSSDEFLWLGFVANDAYIVIACDVSDGTQITGDVEPLSQEKKQNGYMVAGIAGGMGFLAVCVIIGFMVYRRIKANKTNRKVEDDKRNLPTNEDTSGINHVSNNVKELQ